MAAYETVLVPMLMCRDCNIRGSNRAQGVKSAWWHLMSVRQREKARRASHRWAYQWQKFNYRWLMRAVRRFVVFCTGAEHHQRPSSRARPRAGVAAWRALVGGGSSMLVLFCLLLAAAMAIIIAR